LINLASPEKKKYAMSSEALKQELIRCAALKIPFVVLHPGSHMDTGAEAGIERIASAINRVFDKLPENPTRLLLETTAGQGSGLGHTFEQIAAIMGTVEDKDRIGVCLDTCHIFAAGYDLRTEAAYKKTFYTFDKVIGLGNLYWIHVNDSKREMGTRIDRHESIGKGFIGETAFKLLMNDSRLQNIPKVLETPKGKEDKDWDQINLAKLRGFFR
ncbi:MAG: deoxyribonuclease IV, partial [Thermodesulfobacteriota bacterium]|nr:deoxyribonuclease IV [Thermodesulfobacteriota bacterium]